MIHSIFITALFSNSLYLIYMSEFNYLTRLFLVFFVFLCYFLCAREYKKLKNDK